MADTASWAEARAHLLAQPMRAALRDWIESDSPYRPAYVSPPSRKFATTALDPWLELRRENPFVYGSAAVGELCLVWLAREFGTASGKRVTTKATHGD